MSDSTLSNTSKKESGIVVFDLDDTLSSSKVPPDKEMAELFVELLSITPVVIIGGGKYAQFQEQFLQHISIEEKLLYSLFLFPTSGTAFYRYKRNVWECVYEEALSESEKKEIMNAFDHVLKQIGFDENEKSYGPRIEDRSSQITFSALGQEAPVDLKKAWDPDKKKRNDLKGLLAPMLPNFEVRTGGSTSIDITKKGIDKSYAIKKIEKHLGFTVDEMLFVGDRLEPGGNDYEVLSSTGVLSFSVNGPEETKNWIREYIKETKSPI